MSGDPHSLGNVWERDEEPGVSSQEEFKTLPGFGS